MEGLRLKDIRTEYQENPLGLDEKHPRFSWKLAGKENGCAQSAYRLLVGTKPGLDDMWDSGKAESDCSIGVTYSGKELKPCTRYWLTVTVWDETGEAWEPLETWFETGFLDASKEAWDGAEWIGAPEKYVRAETIGVFVISSRIKVAKGSSKAGIVFGANDARLLDTRKNQYEIAGENYIRYVLDVSTEPATLFIYRVGYHKEDSKDVPFASIPVVALKKEGAENETREIISFQNCYDEHELTVEVIGNCAYTYVDGILVDAVEKESFYGKSMEARQLNPLSFNDTTTFPRLCEIGYYVGAGDTAHFSGLCVKNYRTPQNVIVSMDEKEGGTTLSGMDEAGTPKEIQVVKSPSCHSIPMLRRDFIVSGEKELAGARLYVTARGIYDCRLNGKEITDTWLNPGLSQYDRHIMYQTYDVTEFLHAGENGIGITLSSGWWCDSQTFVLRNYNYFGDRESVLAKLVLTYGDGTAESFVTNTKDWYYFGEGPYTYAGFFQGEHLDGRKLSIYEDFSLPGYRIEGMKKPAVIRPETIDSSRTMPEGFGRSWPKIDHSRTEIAGGINAPVVEVCRRYAVSMTQPRKGMYIYDFEQEMAGVPFIKLHGKAGTKVTIRYGEMLYPKLPEYGELHGLMLTENYRDAESIDCYILKGDAVGETYCPRFTFHGYRYLEITGIEEPPKPEDVGTIQLSSVREITGKLETSNPLLNRFIENVKWSQLCNFISVPTDCPQRNERMGWAGDTHVFCRTASYQSDTRLFYYRYLEALRDLQEESGQLPDIAPVGGGFGGITYESAMIFMVWELFQHYNDKKVVEKYYDSMKKWMGYIRGQGMPGMAYVGPLGDWLAPEETDEHLIWNAFYARDAELMKSMAYILGNEEDADCFKTLENEAKSYWNKTFVERETGKTKAADGTVNDTQCSYALPLAYHVFSDENKERAYAHLARKTKEVGYTVSTGFFGTGVLNPMLSEGGHTDMAYRLIQQTAFPSWLYPVTQGATTIWERWNSYTLYNGFGGNNSMNSFNHYSLGSVLSWIYEEVLGIKRDEKKPGYRHFILQPAIPAAVQEPIPAVKKAAIPNAAQDELQPENQPLTYAKGGFESAYGRIESGWEIIESGYRYECCIPENTTADVRLPDRAGGYLEKVLGSGSYSFLVTKAGLCQLERKYPI